MTALINGISASTVSVYERGLQFGDGLFETIAVIDGKRFCWPEHLARLKRGLTVLGIGFTDFDALDAETQRLAPVQGRGVIKIIITRGDSGRGYRPPTDTSPTRIVTLNRWPEFPAESWQQGVRTRLCRTRLGINPLLAGIKHLNRIENVLARGEWSDDGIAEGLLLDHNGHLVEGTTSNLFLLLDGTLVTPSIDDCGIEGTVRNHVLSACGRLGIATAERKVQPDELAQASEVFLSNSLTGIRPVTAVDGYSYPVGGVTRRLQQDLLDRGITPPLPSA